MKPICTEASFSSASFYDSFGLGEIEGDRLFAEHGLPGLNRKLNEPGVRLGGRDDDDRINARMVNGLLDLGEGHFGVGQALPRSDASRFGSATARTRTPLNPVRLRKWVSPIRPTPRKATPMVLMARVSPTSFFTRSLSFCGDI